MPTDVTTKPLELTELSDGDKVEITFDPPLKDPDFGPISRAEGTLQTIVSLYYLHADELRKPWGMGACLDLNHGNIRSLRLIEPAWRISDRKHEAARGQLVYQTLPRSPIEVEAQLAELAEIISVEKDTSVFGGRRRQLTRQFDDIADLVSLAKTKRSYILTRAIVGEDFHPYLTRDDRVFRNGTVRPLPADFEIERARRIDRGVRLEQAVRIFGEAERETRDLAAYLRRIGYDVRRPHPNAQELLIRFAEGRHRADAVISPSRNGLWECRPQKPENKTKERAITRLLRADVLRALQWDIQTAADGK